MSVVRNIYLHWPYLRQVGIWDWSAQGHCYKLSVANSRTYPPFLVIILSLAHFCYYKDSNKMPQKWLKFWTEYPCCIWPVLWCFVVESCRPDDERCNRNQNDIGTEEFVAIQQIHHLIDDDQNGNVDPSESDEVIIGHLQTFYCKIVLQNRLNGTLSC